MTRTIRDAVQEKQGTVARRETSVTAAIEADLNRAHGWFKSVAPRHVDADQFVSLCLGAVRKGDKWLKRAVVESPWTLMQAASECARLGLVPGETYHFAAFKHFDKDTRVTTYRVVGIVDYKGEIDQIYRAGGVRSVHCHVVRANDTFIWRPGQMDVPHHRIFRLDGDEQEGLADDGDRGHLTGVYAYAVMADGGYSQPVVMGASTVKKHRDVAKTDKFWGPPWPEEGPWTEDMWRKTAIHKLFDMVPHSAEFLAERLRGAAALERAPETVRATVEEPKRQAALPVAAENLAESHQDGPGDPERHDDPSVPLLDPEARLNAARNALAHQFQLFGLHAKNLGDTRRAIVTGLIGADTLVDIGELSAEQLEEVTLLLRENMGEHFERDRSSAAKAAREYASRVAAAIMQHQEAQ